MMPACTDVDGEGGTGIEVQIVEQCGVTQCECRGRRGQCLHGHDRIERINNALLLWIRSPLSNEAMAMAYVVWFFLAESLASAMMA